MDSADSRPKYEPTPQLTVLKAAEAIMLVCEGMAIQDAANAIQFAQTLIITQANDKAGAISGNSPRSCP